jgi:hypothetical protein
LDRARIGRSGLALHRISAALEAPPKTVGDDAERQKDGYYEEGQRREHLDYPAEINSYRVGNAIVTPQLRGRHTLQPRVTKAFQASPAELLRTLIL